MALFTNTKTAHSNGLVESKGVRGAATRARKSRLLRLLGILLAFLVCVAALTREPSRDIPSIADLSSPVAVREIRAMFYFESVDLQRTQEARDLEVTQVPEYYRIDYGVIQKQLDALNERIQQLRKQQEPVASAIVEALLASTSDQSVESIVTRIVSTRATELKQQQEWETFPEADLLALWLTPDMASIPERVFESSVQEGENDASQPVRISGFISSGPPVITFNKSDTMGKLALDALEYVLAKGIREETLFAAQEAQKIVILREDSLTDLPLTSEMTLSEAPDIELARDELTARLIDTTQKAARDMALSERWARMHDAALAVTLPLLAPTLQNDKVYTAGARARAAEAVPPVMKEIEAGEIIQDRGKRWTKQSRSDVETYIGILANDEEPFYRILNTLAAHAILVFLVFIGIHKRVHFSHEGNETASSDTAFRLALLLLCATLVIGRIVSYFEPTGYVLPVAAAGILYAILVGPQRAALFGALAATLVSAQFQYNWRLLLVSGAMTIAGAFSIYGVRKRSDMTAAALVSTLVGLLAVGAVILSTDTLFGDIFLRRIFLIVLNGGLCLLAVPGLLPWLERMFGITTDIQLLEYTDLNNELLRKLAMAAPATYAHSLLLGQIAEAAADAIGANGLLARVCAYYHDIGKRQKPEHFTENQQGQRNIHETLSPLVSARMIRQHVVEGAREAQEHRLPQPIIDGILEHHGACRISFFYEQALKQNPELDIPEMEFRYPGPKPQRPETAILMICDASESGVRTLEHPTLENVTAFVNKIIRMRADDNQFEECNLTLKQLARIRDVVARALVNSMHTRIAYPAYAPPNPNANPASETAFAADASNTSQPQEGAQP